MKKKRSTGRSWKKMNKSFSIKSRFQSFVNAFSGLFDMLTTEPNAWIHAAVTVLVLSLAWWLRVDQEGFALTIVAVVAVWVAEAFNTVLELMVDMVTSEKYSRAAKRARDIAAAAVLISTIGAIVIGVVILGVPLWHRVKPFIF
jgi:diacylglycerol kinase (ATP)